MSDRDRIHLLPNGVIRDDREREPGRMLVRLVYASPELAAVILAAVREHLAGDATVEP